MTLLAIDPGRSVKPSIGYAMFGWEWQRREGPDGPHREQWWSEWERGELTWDELCLSLKVGSRRGVVSFNGVEFDEVVIENFINNPKSRGGQTNGTSETIGAVEYVCFRSGVLFTRQPSSILGPAKLMADYQGTLQHLPHQDSAYLHGYYYLVGKGVLQSKGLSSTL